MTGKITRPEEEDRERYFDMYKSQGIDVAITELHNEIGVLEPKVFDGGYNKERFEQVQKLRLLAQEMWNIKLREKTAQAYGESMAEIHFGKDFAKIK